MSTKTAPSPRPDTPAATTVLHDDDDARRHPGRFGS